ncbi:MAG: VOC family protein [Pseudomonadota bacterium]
MSVRRIVPNVAADNVPETRSFYSDLLGLKPAMDLGQILIFSSPHPVDNTPQCPANENAFEQAMPGVSVEVDDVDALYDRAKAGGFDIASEPKDEPFGVRRFRMRDPFGTLVNILSPIPQPVHAAT